MFTFEFGISVSATSIYVLSLSLLSLSLALSLELYLSAKNLTPKSYFTLAPTYLVGRRDAAQLMLRL